MSMSKSKPNRLVLTALIVVCLGSTAGAQVQTQDDSPAPDALAIARELVDEADALRAGGQELEAAQDHLRRALQQVGLVPVTLETAPKICALLDRLGAVADGLSDPDTGLQAFEFVVAWRERTLAADDVLLLEARMNLARLLRRVGRIAEARKLYELNTAALAGRPDSEQIVYRMLGHRSTLALLDGDVELAAELQQRAYDACRETLPFDHPDLAWIRHGLCGSRIQQGELAVAWQLVDEMLAAAEPPPVASLDRLKAREQELILLTRQPDPARRAAALADFAVILGGVTPVESPEMLSLATLLATQLRDDGDPSAATQVCELTYALLQQLRENTSLAVRSARARVAQLFLDFGDHIAALTLLEDSLALVERDVQAGLVDPDDWQVAGAIGNVADVRRQLGDLEGARELQEDALARFSRTLPADSRSVLLAKGHLASTLLALGEADAALVLASEVVAGFERTVGEDDELLLWGRRQLGMALRDTGAIEEALAVERKLLDAHLQHYRADHPVVIEARRNLLQSAWAGGVRDEVVRQSVLWAQASRDQLRSWVLAPRQLGTLGNHHLFVAAMLLSIAAGDGELPPLPELDTEALLTLETMRGIETRAARRVRRGHSAADRQELDRLSALLSEATDEVLLAAGRGLPMGDAHEGAVQRRNIDLARAVTRKEAAQRAIHQLAYEAPAPGPGPRLADLAERLPANAAALSYFSYEQQQPRSGEPAGEPSVVFLLRHGQTEAERIELGPDVAIETALVDLREAVTLQQGRGGRLALREPSTTAAGSLPHEARVLAEKILDPVLARLDDDVDTLYISLGEVLLLAPFDALPDASGVLLGERYTVRPLVSLLELLEVSEVQQDSVAASAPDEAGLLVVGDIRYGTRGSASKIAERGATEPVATTGLRFAPPGGFSDLPGTAREIEALGALYGASHAGQPRALGGAQATKPAFLSLAPGARFVHIATHGYFADPEQMNGLEEASIADPEQRVSGLSPLVLTGLALAGANGADGRADVSGLLTAEELLTLDLSGCELVTLSACDTSLGVRRAGQGHASLRAALQGAGARYVLTSLWRVGDEPTADLMATFYRGLWVDGLDAPEALWRAKMKARAGGAGYADWAGWVLTGL